MIYNKSAEESVPAVVRFVRVELAINVIILTNIVYSISKNPSPLSNKRQDWSSNKK